MESQCPNTYWSPTGPAYRSFLLLSLQILLLERREVPRGHLMQQELFLNDAFSLCSLALLRAHRGLPASDF